MFELDPNMDQGPWAIIRLSANYDHKIIDIDKVLWGFTVYSIPFLTQQMLNTWELVIETSCVSALKEALKHQYTIEYPYDPTTLDPREVAVHGEQRARTKTRNRFLHHAVDAIKDGWGKGPASCYRETASLGGLEGALQTKLGADDTYITIQCS